MIGLSGGSYKHMSINRKYPDLMNKYTIIGRPDDCYNSIAWAMGDTQRYWDPHPYTYGYWPNDLDKELTADVLLKLFFSHGYTISENTQYENGARKVVIYVRTNYYQRYFYNQRITEASHVAVLQELSQNTGWTSKIEKCELINHQTPESIENNDVQNGVGVILSNYILEKRID
jgi:hypothetical protein